MSAAYWALRIWLLQRKRHRLRSELALAYDYEAAIRKDIHEADAALAQALGKRAEDRL